MKVARAEFHITFCLCKNGCGSSVTENIPAVRENKKDCLPGLRKCLSNSMRWIAMVGPSPVMNTRGLLQEHFVENGLWNTIAWTYNMKICPKSTETNLQNAKGNVYKMVKPSVDQPEEKKSGNVPTFQKAGKNEKNLVCTKCSFQVEVRSTWRVWVEPIKCLATLRSTLKKKNTKTWFSTNW